MNSQWVSYNITRYAHGHEWLALREFSTPGEIYVAAVSPFFRIIFTLSCCIVLYLCSQFAIIQGVIADSQYTHARHNISDVYVNHAYARERVCRVCRVCAVCLCVYTHRLRVYYNLIYIFNVFIARRLEGEIIITIMTADYCAGRGSPLYIS